jgi:hypothetical protein
MEKGGKIGASSYTRFAPIKKLCTLGGCYAFVASRTRHFEGARGFQFELVIREYQLLLWAGVIPKFETLNGTDPVAFILAQNVKRRHLNKGQQAMALAFAYPEPEKGGRGKKKTVEISSTFSSKRLQQARQVLKHSRDLALAVLGSLTVRGCPRGSSPVPNAMVRVEALECRLCGRLPPFD